MTRKKDLSPSAWIVDNNQECVEKLLTQLQNNTIEVKVFADGFQCLDYLENIAPDLIFIEMALPGLNGIETIRSIKAKKADQKIIGMSGQAPQHQQRFMDAGCISFISKPVQQDEIDSCLSKALNCIVPDKSQVQGQDQTSADQQSTEHKILIAEDNEINCLILENQLMSLNCKFDVARDGGQAVEKLMQTTYSLALIDLHMPIMDGVNVIKKIRCQTGPNQLTKMIAVSGFAEKRMEKSALRNGFDNYITKPIDLQALKEIIESVS